MRKVLIALSLLLLFCRLINFAVFFEEDISFVLCFVEFYSSAWKSVNIIYNSAIVLYIFISVFLLMVSILKLNSKFLFIFPPLALFLEDFLPHLIPKAIEMESNGNTMIIPQYREGFALIILLKLFLQLVLIICTIIFICKTNSTMSIVLFPCVLNLTFGIICAYMGDFWSSGVLDVSGLIRFCTLLIAFMLWVYSSFKDNADGETSPIKIDGENN